MKRLLKNWYFLISLILITPIAISFVVSKTLTETIRYERVEVFEELSHQQELWLNVLEWCESRGNSNAINEDDGGSRSVGSLQFKDATFQHFSDYYNLDYRSDDIWDRKKQRNLAHFMLSDGLEYHWKNCSNYINESYPNN